MASEIFGNPSFTRFWTARSASGFAYHMTAVAVGWQVYAMTGSAFMLGLVGLTEFLPQFLLTLVVGQVADRVDRRRIAGVCQLIEAVALLTLLAETAGWFLGLGGMFACVGLTMGLLEDGEADKPAREPGPDLGAAGAESEDEGAQLGAVHGVAEIQVRGQGSEVDLV